MPYIENTHVAEVRKSIKAKFPNFKFSITREDHVGIRVSIMEAPFDLLPHKEDKHEGVNQFYIKKNYKDLPETRKVLEEVYAIMNKGNCTESIDGDYGTIPKFYTYLEIGKWDKKFKVIDSK